MVLALTCIHVAIILVAATVFVAAAISDARSYRIPNKLCTLLLVLFPLYAATAPRGLDWQHNLLVCGAVSIFCFAAYLAKWIGAGDVKLLSVASLWAGPGFLAILLVVTAFAGGVESLVAVYALRRKAHQNNLRDAKIPYGIAIASGGLTMLGLMARSLLLPV